MTIACGKCGAAVEVVLNPQHRIINMETVSFMIIEHSAHTVCSGCLSKVLPIMRGAQGVLFVAAPVTEPQPERSSIIVPN
jgi:hypothetical protein